MKFSGVFYPGEYPTFISSKLRKAANNYNISY
jgi:hypothetical protein